MAKNPLDEIFAASQEQSLKRLHDQTQEESRRAEKARRVRRALRAVVLAGTAIIVLCIAVGQFYPSLWLGGLCILSGMAVMVAFPVLFFMGGTANPRVKTSLSKAARRRLND